MSAKTKIVVLRMKEIIYTAIFIGLALFLVFLFLFMFRSGKDETSPTADSAPASYTPGIYSASIVLGNQNANVEVTVDADRITSVALIPLSETVETMYPLMQPAMETLASQIVQLQSLEGIEYPAGSQYTSMALMNAIETALSKAKLPES
ncbi:MAG: hypothetical protein E7246_05545 [Lachnoclostridium sp.]|nr:hypothetical protein [Lachnoclostridium sp.]